MAAASSREQDIQGCPQSCGDQLCAAFGLLQAEASWRKAMEELGIEMSSGFSLPDFGSDPLQVGIGIGSFVAGCELIVAVVSSERILAGACTLLTAGGAGLCGFGPLQ